MVVRRSKAQRAGRGSANLGAGGARRISSDAPCGAFASISSATRPPAARWNLAHFAAHSTDPIELMMADRTQETALRDLGDQKSARRHIDRALAHDAAAGWRPRMVSPGFDLVVSVHYFRGRILCMPDHPAYRVFHEMWGRMAGQVRRGTPLSFEDTHKSSAMIGDYRFPQTHPYSRHRNTRCPNGSDISIGGEAQ